MNRDDVRIGMYVQSTEHGHVGYVECICCEGDFDTGPYFVDVVCQPSGIVLRSNASDVEPA